MKAMILAAGEGRRLRPLTDRCPKALIEVGGVPMLEIVIRRLMRAGVDAVVVNTFHLADQIEAFLKSRKNFGIRIEISREEKLLDTGGGLKKVSWFFDDGKPFFLHTVDAVTNIALMEMYRFHEQAGALATLAVQIRPTARHLLFDERGLLCGWESVQEKKTLWAKGPVPSAQRLAFNAIHVISPDIFPKIREEGVFSITPAYLRLAGEGERIAAFRCDRFYWHTMGTPEKLERVQRYVQRHGLTLA